MIVAVRHIARKILKLYLNELYSFVNKQFVHCNIYLSARWRGRENHVAVYRKKHCQSLIRPKYRIHLAIFDIYLL